MTTTAKLIIRIEDDLKELVGRLDADITHKALDERGSVEIVESYLRKFHADSALNSIRNVKNG